VFNLLLQVMDHGTLTDNNGRKADFRHVIIVMTTNAGAQEMSRPAIGFVNSDNASDGMEAIRRMFTPEFRNRLDAVIQFSGLDLVTIERVVDKLIVEVEMQLEQKGVTVSLDDDAVAGSRRRATTRRWVPARWPGRSRNTSSGPGRRAPVRAPRWRRQRPRLGRERWDEARAGMHFRPSSRK